MRQQFVRAILQKLSRGTFELVANRFFELKNKGRFHRGNLKAGQMVRIAVNECTNEYAAHDSLGPVMSAWASGERNVL